MRTQPLCSVVLMALLTPACGGSDEPSQVAGNAVDASTEGAAGSGGSLPDAADGDANGNADVTDASDQDSASADGSTAGDAIATLGDPCSEPGAMACSGHASKLLLLCDGSSWVANGTCIGDQFCDSRTGPSGGSCQPGIPGCVDQAPGFAACDGATLHICGPDLVTEETLQCGSAALCAAHAGPVCDACSDGDFRCTGADLETCNPDRTGFNVVESCQPPSTCVAAQQRCVTCLESKTDSLGVFLFKDMYLMIDRSVVMAWGSAWTNLVPGIDAFLAQPVSAGLGIGISFFPEDDSPDLADPTCSGTALVDPLVGWDTYPVHADDITSSLSTTQATGQTYPLQQGLNGVLLGTRARMVERPGNAAVAVLLSKRNSDWWCPVINVYELAEIAAGFWDGTPSTTIHTLDFGNPASESLPLIASSGGGTYTRVDTPQKVTAALEKIRDSLVGDPCQYPIPAPPVGPLDPATVFVSLVQGGTPTPIAPVPVGDSCDASGWRFNDTTNPTRVVLCPDSCAAARASADNHVAVTVRVCD